MKLNLNNLCRTRPIHMLAISDYLDEKKITMPLRDIVFSLVYYWIYITFTKPLTDFVIMCDL